MPGPLDADESSNASVDSAESVAQPSAYELQRERNIARNAAFLDEVGLGRDHVQSAPSKVRVRPAASEPALARRKQPTRKCTHDPSVAAAAAARADAVADVQRQPVAAAASEVDAAGRMREHMRRQRQRPGPRPKDGSISTVCRKVDCRRVAVRGPKGRALAHGLCRICAAEARVGAMATAALQRSKRKAEDNAAGAAAAVHRQPSANAKGKARRVVREDEEEDVDDAFDEVYKCRTDGCCLQATRFKSGLPTGHGMCRVHGPYKERVRCSIASCDERAQVNGRCKLHKA